MMADLPTKSGHAAGTPRLRWAPEVALPILIALPVAIVGTGAFAVLGLWAWLLFAGVGSTFGAVFVWGTTYARVSHRKGSAAFVVMWVLTGAIAFAMNVGTLMLESGSYDVMQLGPLWYVWVLSPTAAIATTLLRSVRSRP